MNLMNLPTEVVISGKGWCSDEIECNIAKDQYQYIEVDFNSEVVVEAILVLGVEKSLVTHYNVEYAGLDRVYHRISERTSNESVSCCMHVCSLCWLDLCFILFGYKVFSGIGSCVNEEPSNFTVPVIARYIRAIPIHWAGFSACLRMELYGCTVKGTYVAS